MSRLGRIGRAPSVVAALLAAAGAPIARAEPATAELLVDRSEQAAACEDTPELAARINRIAGRTAIGGSSPPVQLNVAIDRFKGKYSAHLTVTGAGHGERDFEDEGESCTALAEAVAVSIALLLDDIPSKPAPPPPHQTPPTPPPQHSEAPLPRIMLDVLVVESVDVVGPSTFGVTGSVDVRVLRNLTVGAGVFGFIESLHHFGAGEIHLNLVGFRVPACLILDVGNRAISGQLCGYPALGAMIARGQGFERNQSASQPWFGMGAAAVGTAPIVGPLAFASRVDLIVPIVRPNFVVQNLGNAEQGQSGVAFETPPVGVAVAIGLRALVP